MRTSLSASGAKRLSLRALILRIMRAQQLPNARYAFVDVETTGFHPSYARVVEVACLVVERRRTVTSFETLVDPHVHIPGFATEIHGITDACVRGKPSLNAIRRQLLAHCIGATVVAHNAPFDLNFLPFLRCRPVACSYRLAARLVPEARNHKNQTLRRFFQVKDPALQGRRPHRAMADAVVTRHVFYACLDRYLNRGFEDDLNALLRFLRTPKDVILGNVA